jgi:hypothetical protein
MEDCKPVDAVPCVLANWFQVIEVTLTVVKAEDAMASA